MIKGMIAGTAIITGDAAMKYAVTGVMTLKIRPHQIFSDRTAITIHALMMGPVINTLKFLNIWLAILSARRIAIIVICLVPNRVVFMIFLCSPP